MIRAEDIFALLDSKPFKSFRIHLKGGKYYDIVRAFNNVPAKNYMAIGIPRVGDTDPNPIAEKSVKIPYAEMDRVEFLETASHSQRA